MEFPFIGRCSERSIWMEQKCLRLWSDQAHVDSAEDSDKEVVTPELGFEE